jgi:hypothetical protein
MSNSKVRVLYQEEGEFSTSQVLRIGPKYFIAVRNGGERGSHQVNNRFPSYLEGPDEVSQEDALAECIRLGADRDDIAKEAR